MSKEKNCEERIFEILPSPFEELGDQGYWMI